MQYISFDWVVTKSKMFSITPMCMNAQTHATDLLFQTATTGLWNGTSIISFYFCLLFKGRIFWQAMRRQVFETQSKGMGGTEEEWGRKASADHTIRNPQTLASLKCHSCDQPFHLRGARSSTSATQEALKLKGFRQLGPLAVTICMPLSFSRHPQPWGLLLLRASTSVPFMKCQERWVLIEKQLMEKICAQPEPRTGKSC